MAIAAQHHRGRSVAVAAAERQIQHCQQHAHSQSRSTRRASILSSSSSLSSLLSPDPSVYEAEVFVDADALDAIHYPTQSLDKDESNKLYAAPTNTSTTPFQITHIEEEARPESRTSRRNRDSVVIGSPSSNTRPVDYSEYTYDLGWTAASRIHSQNSSLFQIPPHATFQNASPGAFGSPGFGSPGFLATDRSGHSTPAASTADNHDDHNEEDEHSRSSLESTDSASLLHFRAQPIAIGGQEGDYLPTHVTGTSPYSTTSFVNANVPAETEQYHDSDLNTLIDYASPRVPPFPSTAEAEELLYSRMSTQSRAALAKLMRGRNPAVPRPPRFRPPISQNMGYGAIQRHPFYYAPSRSPSNARSVVSEPGATSQPAYRRLNRTLLGDFGDDDVGFWDSMKAFFTAECCFCFGSDDE